MEIFEVKYFLQVADTENIHKASKLLNISPSAVSKAISRLEKELKVPLFYKIGRNIKITEHGKRLQSDGARLVALEKQMKESYSTDQDDVLVRLSGPELPLSIWAPRFLMKLQQEIPAARFEMTITSNRDARDAVHNHQADFAFFISQQKQRSEHIKKIDTIEFATFVSASHTLSSRRNIDVHDLIEHRFVVPDFDLIGGDGKQSANDGWREDKFSRKKLTTVSSLKCLDGLIRSGLAVGYLPDYYGREMGFKKLLVKNCPYNCKQYLYLQRSSYSLDRVWQLFA